MAKRTRAEWLYSGFSAWPFCICACYDFTRLQDSRVDEWNSVFTDVGGDCRADFAGAFRAVELVKFPFVRPFRFLTRFRQTPVTPVVQAPGGDFEREDSSLGSATWNSC